MAAPPPAKRRAVVVVDDAQRVVLECNDLCALIFSYVHRSDKLASLACVSREWNRRVFTAPGAWAGTVSFIDGVPRDLRWLAATRDALVIMPFSKDPYDLKRVMQSGTNVSSRSRARGRALISRVRSD